MRATAADVVRAGYRTLQVIRREVDEERRTGACGKRERGDGASTRDEVDWGVDVRPHVRAEREAVPAVRVLHMRRVRRQRLGRVASGGIRRAYSSIETSARTSVINVTCGNSSESSDTPSLRGGKIHKQT